MVAMNLSAQANWTEITQSIASMAGVFIGLFGFLILTYQIHQLHCTIQAETHEKLYSQARDVMRIFIEHPEMRPFFYEGVDIQPDDPRHQQLATMAEIMADYLEHITLQRKNLPRDVCIAW